MPEWTSDVFPWLCAIALVYCDRILAWAIGGPARARPRAAQQPSVVFSRAVKRHPTSHFIALSSSSSANPNTTSVPAPAVAKPAAAKPSLPPVVPVVSTASPPSTPYDDRPPVKPLLDENAAKISALRTELLDDPLFDAQRHDELWLLRFLLSHKKSVAAAAKAARATLQWRKNYNVDQLAAELQATPGPAGATTHPIYLHGHRAHIRPGGLHFVHPDPRRAPVLIGSMTGFDYHAAMEKLTRAEYTAFARLMNEWFAIQCDRVTRETGLLTKQARFVQCRDFSMRSLNREWLRMDGAVGKEMEDCYPQLLGLIVVLDPPHWALVMWRAVKLLFPARMVEKVDLIPTSAKKELERRVLRFISLDDLPMTHGGKREPYKCPVHGVTFGSDS